MFAALLAEFAGTSVLTFTAGCVAASKSVPEEWAPTANAFAFMVLVYSTALVSGGHLNPAVSLAVGLAEKMNFPTIFAYVLAQACGGFLGAYGSRHIYAGPSFPRVQVGPLPGVLWWEAMVVEVLYTAVLALVFLCVTARRQHAKNNPNQFYGLAIGFVLIAAGSAGGKLSGAIINPAISLGLGFWGESRTDMYWGAAYVLYHTAGAGIAALLFYATHPEDFWHDERVRSYEPALGTRLISEFIGTFFLVLTFGLSVLSGSVSTAWAVGAMLTCMIYSLGHVSGGHFNPAVTLAAVLSRKIDITAMQGALYTVIQLLGAGVASILYAGLSKGRTFPLEPRLNYTEAGAYLLEGIFTSMLCLTVLSTGYAKGIKTQLRRNYYFGLAAGLVYFAGSVACARVSGASLNPAVSFGIAFSHKLNYGNLYYFLSYSLAEYIGAATAVITFVIIHAEVYKPKPKFKPQSVA